MRMLLLILFQTLVALLVVLIDKQFFHQLHPIGVIEIAFGFFICKCFAGFLDEFLRKTETV
jgi:hypothetical protein